MLEYFLDEIEADTVTYSYIPYRDDSYRGFVTANRFDGSLVEASRSSHPNDRNDYVCCGKLLGEIRSFAASAEFSEHGFIVWG